MSVLPISVDALMALVARREALALLESEGTEYLVAPWADLLSDPERAALEQWDDLVRMYKAQGLPGALRKQMEALHGRT